VSNAFFKEVWSERHAKDMPPEIKDPSLLRRTFLSEARSEAWAVASEAKINSTLSAMVANKAGQTSIRCKSTICEVLLVIPRASMPPAENIDQKFGENLSGAVDKIASSLDKEATLAISNGNDQPDISVAIYFS
jgi:hypothetical protein